MSAVTVINLPFGADVLLLARVPGNWLSLCDEQRERAHDWERTIESLCGARICERSIPFDDNQED